MAAISASAAMVATLATPAAADGPLDGLLDEQHPVDAPATDPVVTEPAEPEPEPAEPVPDLVEELVADMEPGPVGVVDSADYEALWIPGDLAPIAIKTVDAGDDVELTTFDDVTGLLALLEIAGADAPTTYRFEHAVPEDHTAYVHTDGSVRFVDITGKETAGIAPPWAYDANGGEVPTSYTLDGTTLVQTVDHSDAVYPVVADPWWIPVVIIVVNIALRAGPPIVATYAACQRAHCGPAIGEVVSRVRCHVRNRRGC